MSENADNSRDAARRVARMACRSGPVAMHSLLNELGRRIAAERRKHGIPDPPVIGVVRVGTYAVRMEVPPSFAVFEPESFVLLAGEEMSR